MQRANFLLKSRFAKKANVLNRSKTSKAAQTSSQVDDFEFTSPFSSARLGNFCQPKPELTNFLQNDQTLLKILQKNIPKQHIKSVEDDLMKFSERLCTEIHPLGFQCEQERPYLKTFDAWGNRIDELVTSLAWKRMHDISAEEGLISLGYENLKENWRRLHQMAKLYLYASSSGLYSCPLAMTDGAAFIIRKQENATDKMKNAYHHLTSRDPREFWTSGQWMTEKRGGSDVAGGTETLAVEQSDGTYKLYGYKWFSSATDSDMAFTLARIVDRDNNVIEGTKGLSLFYLETRLHDKSLNGIQILKLKDKLGTRQLPTAELLLDGTIATRVSEEGRGVAGISDMLTLTRIHNAIASASNMRKLMLLSKDYSLKREAFGNKISNYPLHVQTMARMEVEVRAATILVFHTVSLLSKAESGQATEDEQHLLRLMTPLAKLYTAKQAMSVSSEGLESFGGQGYIEETGLPNFLRDSQVLTIWEGTTNVLSLDVLRCIGKSKGQILLALKRDVDSKLSGTPSKLSEEADRLQMALQSVLLFFAVNQAKMDVLSFAARDLAYSLSRIFMGTLLIDHAVSTGMSSSDVYAAKRWCSQQLSLVTDQNQYSSHSSQLDRELVYE